jgi:hypothetical protein
LCSSKAQAILIVQKGFHDAWPDSTNTLPDQVAGIRQLSQRYSYRYNKVGIWDIQVVVCNHAMFRYPDFFKVGISESGNHIIVIMKMIGVNVILVC